MHGNLHHPKVKDNRAHLDKCVKLNAAYGLQRKYFPEYRDIDFD